MWPLQGRFHLHILIFLGTFTVKKGRVLIVIFKLHFDRLLVENTILIIDNAWGFLKILGQIVAKTNEALNFLIILTFVRTFFLIIILVK
jgi:hypothetical protein